MLTTACKSNVSNQNFKWNERYYLLDLYIFHRNMVRLGAHNRTIDADGIQIQDIDVSATFVHENFTLQYSATAETVTATDDIAVLLLARDVEFTSTLNTLDFIWKLINKMRVINHIIKTQKLFVQSVCRLIQRFIECRNMLDGVQFQLVGDIPAPMKINQRH